MVIQNKARAKEILQRELDSIPTLHLSSVNSQKFIKWHRDTRVAIGNVFGKKSSHAREFGYIIFRDHRDRNAYTNGLKKSEAILQSMIGEIEEYCPDDDQAQNPAPTSQFQKQTNTSQVFIIHGRDIGTLALIARFLESLDLEPVILQEQPDRGRTIIEKFED